MRRYEGFDLTYYNGYQIESRCSIAYFPDSEADLIDILSENKSDDIVILGTGNNVILSKRYYREKFIILNGCFDRFDINGNEVVAEAGAKMLQLSQEALRNNLSGFEIFYDIPSSVGGAIVMNAGAAGEEIKDSLVKVRYLDLNDMSIKEIDKNKIDFQYRNSFFQKNKDKIVLKAWFKLAEDNHDKIKNKMNNMKIARLAKQPREFPNCGSVFKRPEGHYVGLMIDEIGLKGFTIGGAKISEKHGGFIINIGNATGDDIIAIITETKKRVKERFGIDLELEQRII
jgi:UDP-N-acetylmuramate dehydrogenase